LADFFEVTMAPERLNALNADEKAKKNLMALHEKITGYIERIRARVGVK
jgi:hypothetical protein